MNLYGVTFNGMHSSNYKAYLRSDNRMILPTLNKREISIPGKNGTYDFDENTYENKKIDVHFTIVETSLIELRLKARQIALWLSTTTKKQLIFDDEPDKYYMAKIYGNISLDEIAYTGTFSVSFECEPFAYFITSTSQDILLGNEFLKLGSEITLGNSSNYIFDISGNSNFLVENFGTFTVRPIVIISGSFSSFSVTVNGKTINYTEAISNNTVTINNSKYTIKAGDINKLSVCTGDLINFFELTPGLNNVSVSGLSLNCTVTFDFKPLFL